MPPRTPGILRVCCFGRKRMRMRKTRVGIFFRGGRKTRVTRFFVGGVLFADVALGKAQSSKIPVTLVSRRAPPTQAARMAKSQPRARVLEVRRRERSRATRVWRARKRRNRAQNESYRAPSRVCFESLFFPGKVSSVFFSRAAKTRETRRKSSSVV